MCGELQKLSGTMLGSAKTRFFELTSDGALAYYVDDRKREQKQSPILILDADSGGAMYSFERIDNVCRFQLRPIKGRSASRGSRVFDLTAPDQVAFERWEKAIKSLIEPGN